MRHLTPLGWQRLKEGFPGDDLEFGNEETFWNWAIGQGAGYRLVAFLIIGMLGGGESDFPGFNEVKLDAHPVRVAWSLDDKRKALIADFLLRSRTFMR